jgi:ribonuclease J
MKIIIHRGSHQIGGCCTEISTDKTRILVDYGASLPGGDSGKLDVPGVTDTSSNCNAVLVSHNHGDHTGELWNVPAAVPVYMGAVAKEIAIAYRKRMGKHYLNGMSLDSIRTFGTTPFCIGDITITPIPSDHSAYDAYMFLIEAGGKRVLHTGDYRLHGPNKKRMLSQIKSLPVIDLLITEGTSIGRSGGKGFDEETVEDCIRSAISRYKYCFVLCASSNIDRIASTAKAVPYGRYFLMDEFQKDILHIVSAHDPGYKRVFRKAITLGCNLKDRLEEMGFCLLARVNPEMEKLLSWYVRTHPSETCLVYSIWKGYIENESISKFCGLTENLIIAHSSGHVLFSDLNSMINTLDPEKIVFIHTECEKEDIGIDKADRIVRLNDKEELEL